MFTVPCDPASGVSGNKLPRVLYFPLSFFSFLFLRAKQLQPGVGIVFKDELGYKDYPELDAIIVALLVYRVTGMVRYQWLSS